MPSRGSGDGVAVFDGMRPCAFIWFFGECVLEFIVNNEPVSRGRGVGDFCGVDGTVKDSLTSRHITMIEQMNKTKSTIKQERELILVFSFYQFLLNLDLAVA